MVQAAQRALVVSDIFGALSLKTDFKCSGFCTPALQAAQRMPVVGATAVGAAQPGGAYCDSYPDSFLLPLPQAAQRVPVVGDIVGALWELRDLVAVASGNAANCATLAAFGADIMRTFDFQGRHVGCGCKQSLHLGLGCKASPK